MSIPNKDTATLSASVKSKEGYNITGAAEWSILEDDMQDIIITPDVVDSHKATITLGEGASGEYRRLYQNHKAQYYRLG